MPRLSLNREIWRSFTLYLFLLLLLLLFVSSIPSVSPFFFLFCLFTLKGFATGCRTSYFYFWRIHKRAKAAAIAQNVQVLYSHRERGEYTMNQEKQNKSKSVLCIRTRQYTPYLFLFFTVIQNDFGEATMKQTYKDRWPPEILRKKTAKKRGGPASWKKKTFLIGFYNVNKRNGHFFLTSDTQAVSGEAKKL